MGEAVLSPIDGQLQLCRQGFQICEQLLSLLGSEVIEAPKSLFAAILPPPRHRPVVLGMAQRIEHHVLVVAQEQGSVWHFPDTLEKGYAVLPAIDHIADSFDKACI